MNIPKCSSEIRKGLNINEYQLVIMLNKRVNELMYGAKSLIEDKKRSYIETAFLELLSGKIQPSVDRE